MKLFMRKIIRIEPGRAEKRGLTGHLSIWALLMALLAISVTPLPIEAQLTSNCINSEECRNYVKGINKSYLTPLAENFARTHAIFAATATPYNGRTSLDIVTVGFQSSTAIVEDRDYDIRTNDDEPIEDFRPFDLEEIETYSIYAGFNLGLLLPIVPIIKDLDIYASHYNDKNEISYFGLRYELIDGIGFSFLGGWKGLALGLGYLSSKSIPEEKEDRFRRGVESILGDLLGEEKEPLENIHVESEAQAVPLELHTAVEVFYISASFAVGALYSSGTTTALYELDAIKDGVRTDVALGPEEKSEVKFSDWLTYAKLGIEVPIFPYVRAGFEIVGTDRAEMIYSWAIRIDI